METNHAFWNTKLAHRDRCRCHRSSFICVSWWDIILLAIVISISAETWFWSSFSQLAQDVTEATVFEAMANDGCYTLAASFRFLLCDAV